MADIEKPAPERQKKPRSFGPPLLIVLGLFLVFAWVGSGQLDASVKLSQDQYLWHLYNGRILEQELRGSNSGTNTIVGSALLPEQAKAVSFRVQFADLRDSEQRLQAIAAERKGDPIAPQQLDEALRGEWYRPVALRVLTSQRREGTARARSDEGGDAPAAPPRTVTSEKLWLQVAAKSHHAWEQHVETERGTYDPGRDDHFYLPERSGHVWVELALDEASDVGELVARLEGAGAAVERLSFDVTPDGGSSWNDAASPLLQWLLYGGPWIALLIFLLFVMRQVRTQGGAGGVMSFGRSRAQLYTKENRTHLTFDDVAGAEEAKVEVRELVEFLKNPGRFTRIGGRIPRGVLLVGPPGCGKTLLAKAIAGEAEVPFFSISGSDFVEMFVGVGASRVRDLFKQARENSPCIIFLDEIDAVGRRRGSGLGGGHDEREQTLNAILVEMDGFGTDEGIIVVAATNRADVLDPALLRPGRFDRQVVIDLPDVEGRKAILDVHLKKVKHGPEIESHVLARATPGYSGADLAAIVNEAAIMTVLDRREAVTMIDLEEAREKVIFGRQKRSRKLEEADRKIVAYHEAGHAVVATQIPEVDPPHKVTIVPRGRALGLTTFLPEREKYHLQRKRLDGQLAVSFGGRVAEEEFCGDISAGASDDIRHASEVARAMVTELGMSDSIGPINYAERQGSDFLGTELMRGKNHSEDTAREIDQEVHRLVQAAYKRAQEIVRSKRAELEEIAKCLLAFETITGDEVKRVLAGARADELRPKAPEPKTKPTPGASHEPGQAVRPGFAGELPAEPGLSPA